MSFGLTLGSWRDHPVILSTSKLACRFLWPPEQTQKLNQIKCVMKTSPASPSKIINAALCSGASGRRPESRTYEQNSHKQTAPSSVTRSLFWQRASLNTECQRRGGGGEGGGRGGGGRVKEEVRQRSMFDTALIPLLSVKCFQHSNNTGP